MRQEENDESQSNDCAPDEARTRDKSPSRWEWFVAFIGLILVTASIGFMFYKAVWGEESPPDIKIKVDSVEPSGNGFLVKFTVKNEGGDTAAGLVLEAELKSGEEPEKSQVTIDYLPSYSSRRGGFFFTGDPRTYDLTLRSSGYQNP